MPVIEKDSENKVKTEGQQKTVKKEVHLLCE